MSLLTQIQMQYQRITPRANGGKAISYKPELAGRVHILQQWSDQTVAAELDDYADYASVYGVYVWVHKAISRIAEAVAPLPVRVVDADDQVIENHPLTVLLATGNDQMSPPDLWQRWVIHMMLAGESFFELVPDSRARPVELWPRRPDQVKVRPDKSPERTLYPRAAGYLYGESDQLIAPEEMWHSKFYNPLNAWRGLAPIKAAREGITIDIFSQAWSKSFLKRGARPDYALIAPQGITRSEREELEGQLMDKFSGSEGWHKPIVLEQGITDIKAFSLPPKDIEWLEQRKISRDEIGGLFGVPDMIMGYGPETYDTEEKIRSNLILFWTLTVVPLVDHRDSSLTHFFTRMRPMLKLGERLDTDLTDVGVLQDDLAPKIEQAGKLFSIGYPLNAINERLGLDMPPVPWGNVGYLPVGLLPAGAGLPESPPTRGFFVLERPMLPGAPATMGGTGKQARPPAYGSIEHKAMWDQHVARLTPHERGMQRRLKREFQRQQDTALRALREGKSVKQTGDIPPVTDLFDKANENQVMLEIFLAVFNEAVLDFARSQLVDFTIDRFVQDNIRRMTIKFAEDINTTTQERMAEALRVILSEATEGGWSIPEIQRQVHDRISDVFNVRKSDFETERIARTEMNKAANMGAIEGMRGSGVRLKSWLAALDDRTRETHVAAHQRYNETPIPLDALFEVGSDRMPGPGQGSVLAEIVNCRCTVISAD